MHNPKVSIIIPVYNGSNYLKDAIDSALAQTYKNVEIIVINDGSNDNGATEEIARSYGKKINYYKKENGGVATALNLGIEKMTGEYFSWLSHDDIYYPEKIEKQVEFLNGLDDKINTIVISDWTIVDKHKKIINQCVVNDRLETLPICFLAFDTITWLNACAMLIPSVIFKKIGDFDEKLKTTQDYDMHLRMIKSGVQYKILHQPLLYSRSHTEQGSVVDSTALISSDVIHQKIISSISTDEINKYFIDYKEILSVFGSYVDNGYRKSLAYFAKSAVDALISVNKIDLAINLIKEKISCENIDSINLDEIDNHSIRKRLMFCSGHWLTGGMERVLSILFKELHDEYDIYLITPYDDRESCILLPDYVNHIKISNDSFYDSFDVVGLFYALLFKIDVMIGFMNMFDKQLDFYDLCIDTGIKTIASNHEHYLFPYKSAYHYNIVKKRLDVFRNVDAATWATNCSVAMYSQYNDNGYVLANPNSFEIEAKSTYRDGSNTILCVGRFNDYIKRIDRILICYKLVLKKNSKAKLILVGKCDRDVPVMPDNVTTINDLLKKLEIPTKNIDFVGEVDDVSVYYKKASLILMTSNNEGFGMVINEAACFGVPAVCNDISGMEDLIIDGENGYITEQDDLEAMASRVNQILSDDELRKILSVNAKKFVRQFDVKIIGDKWRLLINTLLSDQDKEITRFELNKQLSYSIDNCQDFCKILAAELNDVLFSAMNNLDYNKNKRSIRNDFKHYSIRLKKSIKTHGVVKTSKLAIKKLNRRLFKSN